jgi:Flp pilus assembly protein TadD
MTVKFTSKEYASKEIHFLKNDSEGADIKAPKRYFSDLLTNKTRGLSAIEERILETDIPGESFLCAALQLNPSAPEAALEKSKEIFEVTFSALLDHERGIWEMLNETAFMLSFWDYSDIEKAHHLLKTLKDKLSGTLKTEILMGTAHFPFHNFTKEQTAGNALKAIDHAAFFGSDAAVKFDVTSINIYADRLYQLDKLESAIEAYQGGLEIDPKNINLLNSLGVCFGIRGDLEKARNHFDKAIKITPDDPMINYNIGLLYQIEDNLDKAIIYLRRAHNTDDHIFEVELLLGNLLYKKGQFKTALTHLENASAANPKSALAYQVKGNIFLTLNQAQDAGIEFNKAIKLNPSDAVSLSGYAKSLDIQDKNLSIALTFARNSVALEPDNRQFRNRLRVIQEKIDLKPVPEVTIKSA